MMEHENGEKEDREDREENMLIKVSKRITRSKHVPTLKLIYCVQLSVLWPTMRK